MKINNWFYLYVSLWGFAFALSAIITAQAAAAGALVAVVFGLLVLMLVLFVPLAWFAARTAKRLDVLAETGKDGGAL